MEPKSNRAAEGKIERYLDTIESPGKDVIYLGGGNWFLSSEAISVRNRAGEQPMGDLLLLTRKGNWVLAVRSGGGFKYHKACRAEVVSWFTQNGFDRVPFDITKDGSEV